MARPVLSLNPSARSLPASPTVAINELSDELIRQGRKVYKWGLGQSPFPVPERVANALRENAHQKDYLPVAGLRLLREAVAAYHRRRDGVAVSAEDVLIGPGSKELMFNLQMVLQAELVLPGPSWVSYAPQASLAGRKVVWLQTRRENDWNLTPEALDAHCESGGQKCRLLILNYPNNPTGATYGKEVLKELARVARRHQVLVLSDEIYGEVHHDDQHDSIASFYPEGTIISAGLSKWCGAGGWRLGTFVLPSGLSEIKEAMCAMASETFTSVSAPVQYAAVEAYSGHSDIERYLQDSRAVLKGLCVQLREVLRNGGIFSSRAAGGFYLFLDFEAHRERLIEAGVETSRGLCHRLLKDTGVAILPGADFGRPDTELTARIAYVNFDGEAVLQALSEEGSQVDIAFLERYCAETLEACQVLVDWVQSLG